MKSVLQKMAILAGVCLLAFASGGHRADAQSPGCSATVFWDANFGDQAWALHGSIPLVGQHWNDQISSIVVHRGIWVFYWDADFRGERLRLGPGTYSYVGNHWNDQISSARCVEPTW
jgi:hypothetical protein